MNSTALFDDGPEIEFSTEIMCSRFSPITQNLCLAGAISGHLHWIQINDDENERSMSNIRSMKVHKKSVRAIGFTPDSQSIVTVSKDKSIKLRSTETGKMITKYKRAHNSPINCLCVVDNCVLATGDDDGYVKLWDYRQKKSLAEFHDCDDYISDLTCGSDRRTLLTTSGEGTLTVYNVRNKKLQIQSELMDSDLTACQIVKDGTKVVCSTMEGVLYFFNWKEFGNMSDRFPGHPGGIECLSTLDQSLIATGCEDGKIRALSLYPHRIMSVIGRTSTMPIQTLCTSCDTDYLIGTSTSQETLQLIDSKQLKTILNEKKKKVGKRQNNSFFADLEMNEQTKFDDEQAQSSDDSDSSDDHYQKKKQPKKKKKKVDC
ncbi:unnamed protein product [Rotaria socialis]|uniref:WD repeat-containing protein 55 n=1 Tax=Rotaria socialis TaxID=392032 RepID=A0A818FXU2_9BILA|nr:unnamed protein product [Rotaria socialis]CAF3428024.1 unnamed protein product [Rotaria socialis]CAF3482599.1 unnamed protein product [Rotaria socialis]CAF3629570.1 unnamed protein product [Rotaria socialis]CAF3679639.1 unnamed protein product [Rotaria socialis]